MVADNDIVVRTVQLTKTFRDFWLRERITAVRDLNLDIASGTVYGLLGPNGSGKSTTLKIILGLMFPTRGLVRVFGRPATEVGIKGRIGFLPEESYLYPFLDAYETLDYYGRLFHQPRRQRRGRIEMLLDMVGLRGSAHRRIGEYSKGMQRRIGMAQALINDPELLILDEPTAGMDPMAARQFKDLIHELSRRGKTVILSSHLLADMEDVCDRVGILYAGQLRAEGTLDSLLVRRGLTTITTESLDDQTAGQIRSILSERNKQVFSIDAPKDKLEALFLRIVREAQARRERPAQAVGTGEVAEFLRAGPEQKTRKVIEELLAGRQPPAPPSPAAEPLPAEPKRDVLAELTGKPDRPEPERPPTPPPPAPQEAGRPAQPKPAAPPVPADRSVIDSLLPHDQPEKPDHA